MRAIFLVLVASLGLAGPAFAGPEETALDIFQKACLSAPMKPEANVKAFLSLPGFKPRSNYAANSFKSDGSLRQGVYAFDAADKSMVLQVRKTIFASQTACLVEFVAAKPWADFANQAAHMLARQPGYQGQIASRAKSFIDFAMNGYRVELVPVIGGKKYDLVLMKL